MVNENHFRFDRKSFFNFWKMIYGFKHVNRFSKLNTLSLHVRLIFDCRNPVMVGCRNLGGSGILPVLESPDVGRPDSNRNWLASSHGQKSTGSG
jgi:hypothetical protein